MSNLRAVRIHRPSLRLCIMLGSLLVALALLHARTTLVARAVPSANVCGAIASNTTWIPANNPYSVTCNVQVMGGATLTIQPGVTVVFSPTTSLQVDGTLIAQNVTFTSGKATPAKGDWGHIFFTATSVDAVLDANGNYMSGSIIQDSLIEWGGGGTGVNGAIETTSASPFIHHNTIRNSQQRGVYAVARSPNQPVVIKNNSVTGNTAGGIYASASSVVSNTIQGNTTSSDGGGIYAVSSTILTNTVIANSAGNGGGIYASGGTLIGNFVSANTATGYSWPGGGSGGGGGIYTLGGTVTNNQVTGNSVTAGHFFGGTWDGGGIYANGGTLSNNTVNGNNISMEPSSGQAGGARGSGIAASLSTVAGNTVTSNSANSDYTYGGGIYAIGGTITNNTITGNASNASSGVGYGGGVYADGGIVSNNIISNNTATGASDGQGGGAYGDVATTLQQNLLTGNSANEGGAVYAYKGTVTGNTVLTNTTALSGTVYIDESTATANTLRGNTANYGGGLYGFKGNLIGNTAQNNTANLSGGGIYAVFTTTVNGNTVMSNTALSEGGGIYANGGTVSGNRVSFNTLPSFGQGSGLYIIGNSNVSYNHVLSNTALGGSAGGVALNGRPQFQFNNLYGNFPYDAEVITSVTVTGMLNYWGMSPCTIIPLQIYDGNDLPGRGQLLYAPSLYSPLPLAQLAAPSSLISLTGATAITLTWTGIPPIPNVGCTSTGSTGPDASYRIYYDTDGCPPYTGQGLPQGNSPIDVGANTSFVVNGLSDSDYHFVVAAYDYLGRESAYSNEVVRLSKQRKVYLPMILKNG